MHVLIDGEAASMASVIAMAGDKVTMPQNATLWVHNPMAYFDSYLVGYSEDLRQVAQKALKLAADLDTTGESLLNAYVKRAAGKVDRETMKSLMDAETLITAERAVELGLADQIEEPLAKAAGYDMAAIAARQGPHLQSAIRNAVERANQEAPKGPRRPAEPVTMDAKAVIAACTGAGFPALANGIIAAQLAPEAVRERLATARAVRDRLVAGGLQEQAPELIEVALNKSLAEYTGHIVAIKREQLDPDIDSHLPPGGQPPRISKAPQANKVYATRRAAAA